MSSWILEQAVLLHSHALAQRAQAGAERMMLDPPCREMHGCMGLVSSLGVFTWHEAHAALQAASLHAVH